MIDLHYNYFIQSGFWILRCW